MNKGTKATKTIHRCGLKSAPVNETVFSFHKSGINSTHIKVMGLLFVVFTSCNHEDQYKRDVVGEWKYEGVIIDELNGRDRLENYEITNWQPFIEENEIYVFRKNSELNIHGSSEKLKPDLKYKIINNELQINFIDTNQIEKNIAQFKIKKIDKYNILIEPFLNYKNENTVARFTKIQ